MLESLTVFQNSSIKLEKEWTKVKTFGMKLLTAVVNKG